MDVTIYHNPACGTSRNTLAMIRNAGVAPQIVEYLQQPFSREQLLNLIQQAGISVRDALRAKGGLYADLGLEDPSLSDESLLDAMVSNPALINRPFVVTPTAVRLCRPSELVLDLLPPQRGPFIKEDGEVVIDDKGQRVSPNV